MELKIIEILLWIMGALALWEISDPTNKCNCDEEHKKWLKAPFKRRDDGRK